MGPLEAMACGTPVVAWDDGGGPSEAIIDGKTGYLAKPYDVHDFAEKVLKVLSDEELRETMGREAILHVRGSFPWKRHVELIQRTIEKCMHD